MNIRLLTKADTGALRRFLEEHPHGTMEQTWAWGEVQTSVKGREAFFVLGIFEEEELIGSALLIKQSLGFGRAWFWCPNGPVLPFEEKGETAWGILKSAIADLAKKESVIFTRMESAVPQGSPLIAKSLQSRTSYLPRHTLLLDLRPAKEDILAQMTQKGRYNIRIAEKADVKVREGTLNDLDAFYALLKETCERDGFKAHQKNFYEEILKNPDLGARLLVAEKDASSILCAMILCIFKDRAVYYFGASSNEDRKSMAPYLIQWEAIKIAKKAGALEYDFLGIAKEGVKKDSLLGVTQFKTRFGGQRLDYHPAQIIVHNLPLFGLYWILRALRSLLGSFR